MDFIRTASPEWHDAHRQKALRLNPLGWHRTDSDVWIKILYYSSQTQLNTYYVECQINDYIFRPYLIRS